MSDRPRFELSAVQLTASVLSAVTGAVLISFLGVGGTVIGTAVGSLITTSGFSIYQHYLRRTKERIETVAPVVVDHARVWHPAPGYTPAGRAARGRPGVRSSGTAGAATRMDLSDTRTDLPRTGTDEPRTRLEGLQTREDEQRAGSDEPPTRADQPPTRVDERGTRADEPSTRIDTQAVRLGSVRLPAGNGGGEAGNGGGEGGNSPWGWIVAAWRNRPHWLIGLATAAGVFVAVMVVVTIFEFATGRPLAATLAGQRGSGTSLGDVLAGHSGGYVAPQPTGPAAPTPGATGTGGTSGPGGAGAATTPGTEQTSPQPGNGTGTPPAPATSPAPAPTAAPSVQVPQPEPTAPAEGGSPAG